MSARLENWLIIWIMVSVLLNAYTLVLHIFSFVKGWKEENE